MEFESLGPCHNIDYDMKNFTNIFIETTLRQ